MSSSPSTTPSLATESNPGRRLSKRLSHLDKELQMVVHTVESISPDLEVDSCLLQQYEEQLSSLKTELMTVSHDILSIDDEDGGLAKQQMRVSQALFDVRLKIRHLLQAKTNALSPTADKSGVKLPKLSVATFDGNIVNWHSFLEQFSISVYDRSSLSRTEKLTYLRHAVKDGSAKQVVEGLSGSVQGGN